MILQFANFATSPLRVLSASLRHSYTMTDDNHSTGDPQTAGLVPQIPDLLSSISPEFISTFEPYIERYFTRKYFTHPGVDDEPIVLDTCVRVHNNGMCLIYLADGHTVIKEDKRVTGLDFKVKKFVDRSKNKFSGKRKKGAQVLSAASVVCFLQCDDGSKYPVRAGISCRLLELNDRMIEEPCLVKDLTEGYICVVQPDRGANSFENALSAAEYFSLLDEKRRRLRREALIRQLHGMREVHEAREEPEPGDGYQKTPLTLYSPIFRN